MSNSFSLTNVDDGSKSDYDLVTAVVYNDDESMRFVLDASRDYTAPATGWSHTAAVTVDDDTFSNTLAFTDTVDGTRSIYGLSTAISENSNIQASLSFDDTNEHDSTVYSHTIEVGNSEDETIGHNFTLTETSLAADLSRNDDQITALTLDVTDSWVYERDMKLFGVFQPSASLFINDGHNNLQARIPYFVSMKDSVDGYKMFVYSDISVVVDSDASRYYSGMEMDSVEVDSLGADYDVRCERAEMVWYLETTDETMREVDFMEKNVWEMFNLEEIKNFINGNVDDHSDLNPTNVADFFRDVADASFFDVVDLVSNGAKHMNAPTAAF